MLKRFLFAILLALFIPAKAGALELGLTPSHVFSLWTNINNVILDIAAITGDEALIESVGQMEPQVFINKAPRDVLNHALEIEDDVDAMRIQSDLPPKKEIVASDEKTTPSDVFLTSSRILSSLIELIIENTGREHLITPYFNIDPVAGMMPSDVYGLVDLAHRRTHLIYEHASDNPLTGSGGVH